MNVEDLKDLKDKIELLSKSYQIEIGRLLKKNNIIINENKNGVFINLSSVEQNIITELKNFLTIFWIIPNPNYCSFIFFIF